MIHHLHDLKGERKDQILVLSDKNGHIVGEATREECHKGDGRTHLAFLAILVDSDGNIILGRRSGNKSLFKGVWDAAAVSHILPGESSRIAAERRVKEEMGVKAHFKDIGSFYYHARYGADSENEYCHVLIGQTGKDITHNPHEIDMVKKITKEELLKELKHDPGDFAPWLVLAFEKTDLLKYI